MHRQSFMQQILPLTKATPHVKPLTQALSLGSLVFRLRPTQSLSVEHSAEQNGQVSATPVWSIGLMQIRLVHSSASVSYTPCFGPASVRMSQREPTVPQGGTWPAGHTTGSDGTASPEPPSELASGRPLQPQRIVAIIKNPAGRTVVRTPEEYPFERGRSTSLRLWR